MRHTIVEEGVMAVYKGEYWGRRNTGYGELTSFGEFRDANISDPKFCKKPTDMTYDPENTHGYNPEYDKLKKAKLVTVRRTTTIELEILTDI